MRVARWIVPVMLSACLLSAGNAAAQKKDYLTGLEGDKIRDAETPSQKIKLFLTFAADRLKKFQYELTRPAVERRQAERLNALLNAYAGCLDDAAQLIDEAREKQFDVHDGIKEMQAKAKEFLAYLEELSKSGAQREAYQETLTDAIEATRDALADAAKAEKEIAPPPTRRKP